MLKNILKKIRQLEVISKNKINSLFSGNYRSVFKGRGIEFADIRPYVENDDVRDIDWKTSSKQGELYIKTYNETRDNTLFFIIDGSPHMLFSSQKKTKYENLLETFALISFSAVQNGDRVGAIFYGNEKEKIFPPKKGKKNVLIILKFCIENYQTPPSQKTHALHLTKNFRKIFSLLKHSSHIFWLTGETINLSPSLKKIIKMIKTKHSITPIVFQDIQEVYPEKLNIYGGFTFQSSITQKIHSITITPEVLQNLKKIREKKRNRFIKFFKKNSIKTLIFHSYSNIFKELLFFFKGKM